VEAQKAFEFQMDIQSVRNQLAVTNVQLAEVQRAGMMWQQQGHPSAVQLHHELKQHTKELKKQTLLQEKLMQQVKCVGEELSASQHDTSRCIREHTNCTANLEHTSSAAVAESPGERKTEVGVWQDGSRAMVQLQQSFAEECSKALTRYDAAEQGVSTSREMVAELRAELHFTEQSCAGEKVAGTATSEIDPEKQQALLMCEAAAAEASMKLDDCRAKQRHLRNRP